MTHILKFLEIKICVKLVANVPMTSVSLKFVIQGFF